MSRARHQHIFYGAPRAQELLTMNVNAFTWRVLRPNTQLDSCPVMTLPPSTLAAASRRISMMYQNVIFTKDDAEQDDQGYDESVDPELAEGYTTVITWPTTTQGGDVSSRMGLDTTSLRQSVSISRLGSHFMTQDTQDTGSYDYSNASSIANFPSFHFSLHSVTPLDALVAQPQAHGARKVSRKVNLLVAVLEVDGPDSIRVKRGPDAGNEVSLFRMILGDETGGICKLSAWRGVAEDWSGLNPTSAAFAVQKGDIVFLENIMVSWDCGPGAHADAVPITCSASPHTKSKLEICYRAMPLTSQDSRLRPDLRLGLSDAVVNKVASIVKWFEGMAGLS